MMPTLVRADALPAGLAGAAQQVVDMSIAILTSMGLAALLGLSAGFRRWWHESIIVACLVVPLAASGVFAVTLDTPSYFDNFGLAATHLLATSFLCAFVAWGTAAGVHFGATWLYRKVIEFERTREKPRVAQHDR